MTLTNKGLLLIKECIGNITGRSGEKLTQIIEFIDKLLINSQEGNYIQLIYALHSVNIYYSIYRPFIKGQKFTIISGKDIGPLHKGDNTINILQQIAKGGYGITYLTMLNKQLSVTKVPIYKGDTILDFLKESLIHILLVCFKTELLKTLPVKNIPIPDIYFLAQVRAGANSSLMIVMLMLDINFTDLIVRMKSDRRNELHIFDIILQIAQGLKYLQESADFIHRDLHTDNVMVSYTDPYEVDYGPNKLTRNKHVFFIDFGMTCINLGKCGSCQITDTELIAGDKAYHQWDKTVCKNRTYDLRLFLGSIRFNNYVWKLVKKKFPRLRKYLNNLFKEYDNVEKWNYFYGTIQRVDKTFLPENIIEDMKRLLSKKKGCVIM